MKKLRIALILLMLVALLVPAMSVEAQGPSAEGVGAADESSGQPASETLAEQSSGGEPIGTASTPAFSNGVFPGPTPWVTNQVSFYQAKAGEIKAGTLVSRQEFLPVEISSWLPDYMEGGMVYAVTVIGGLQKGDIVRKTYDQLWTDDFNSGSYSSFNGGDFYLLIDDYTHNGGTNRIIDWLHYIVKEADGSYTLVTGQGVYWLHDDPSTLPEIIGYGMRMTEDFEVYRGETLVNPLISSRGYTYSNDGVSGGSSPIASTDYTNDEDIVAPDTAWVDDDWAGATCGDTVGADYIFCGNAFAHVQDGVNAVNPGGTVKVYPGTYDSRYFECPWPPNCSCSDNYSPALIVYKDGLTIKAVDPDPANTVIQATHACWSNAIAVENSTDNGVTGIGGWAPSAAVIVANNVTIEGFTFHRPFNCADTYGCFWNTAGVFIGSKGAGYPDFLGQADGATVQNNVFSDVWHAVYIWHSDHNTITYNTVGALGDTGHWAAIESYDGGSDADINLGNPSNYNTISHNNLADKGIGVGSWAPQTLRTDNTGTVINENVTTSVGRFYSSGSALACWNEKPEGGDVVPWTSEADPWDPCKPTAIDLASFSAQAGADGVTLAWETGTEIDNAGFNLYRALLQDGPYTQVNGAFIAAEGDAVSGASYSFVDTPDYGTYYYKLEDVDYNGVSAMRGPVKVTVARPLLCPLYRPTPPQL